MRERVVYITSLFRFMIQRDVDVEHHLVLKEHR